MIKSLIFWIFLWTGVALSQNQIDTVKIGAYISSLHDFDITENTINADIYLWCLYSDERFDFKNDLEFINCNHSETYGANTEQTLDGKWWFYSKYIVNSRQNFSTKNYPFDDQRIRFQIESIEYSTDDFLFQIDPRDSKVATNLRNFNGWEISDVKFKTLESNYGTNFGDPEGLSSNYPILEIHIDISRENSLLILFKLTIGILVAFFISICVFWIKPTHVDPRFGLSVGGVVCRYWK